MSRIFISYSHKDSVWKDRLEEQLRPLTQVQESDFSVWTDTEIEAGEDWLPAISAALDQATVAVLLVTTNFLNSQFIIQQEIPKLLKRRKKEGVTVIPVIVKPCLWQEINWLSAMQCRPAGDKALSSFGENELDGQLVKIAREIINLSKKRVPPAPTRDITELEGCTGAIAFGAALENGLVVSTDQHEWYWINPKNNSSNKLDTLPAISTTLLKNSSELVVGLYDKQLAFLRNGSWEFIGLPYPVMALTTLGEAVVTGDLSGGIGILYNGKVSFTPVSIREPVIQLLPFTEDQLLILGASGKLWKMTLNEKTAQEVITGQSEAVWQIAPSSQEGCALLMHDQQLTLFDCRVNLVKATLSPLPRGSGDLFRKIIPSITAGHYGLLTEEDKFYLVPDNLRNPELIDFCERGDEVRDFAPHGEGGYSLWTTSGTLYQIVENGTFKKINLKETQYAFSSESQPRFSFVVWKDGNRYLVGEPAKQPMP